MDTGLDVAHALAEGRAAWPLVRLSEEALRAQLDRARVAPEDVRQRAADLFLAAAAAHGDREAIKAIDDGFIAQVGRYLGRVRLSAEQEVEIKQRLRVRLFVGPPPRIGDYRGSGPLGAWVRMCALRLALDLREAESTAAGETDREGLEALAAVVAEPESALAREQHGARLKAALEEALADLSARDKALLRLSFLEGMGIDALGVVYRVHRATVARWLVAIRERVFDHVRQRLAVDLKSTSSEAQSLVRFLRSDIQVSVRRVLAGGSTG
jgi:RNA polymerase sigma-70 factor (ECF subfamily)